MRVLVAFDKFKDAIGAHEACAITMQALQARHPDWIIESAPLTDGGDGFARILAEATATHEVRTTATGPRGAPVDAGWAPVPRTRIPAAARARLSGQGDLVAVIEMATASGLALVSQAERDPWTATSAGTGELMRVAADAGASALLLGVGGSATHDLGLGALQALGFRFLDREGRSLGAALPADWSRLARIEGGPPASFPPVFIACDVDNPLLGPRGAATVFAPQKGLKPGDRDRLETLSASVAEQLCAHCGRDPALMTAPGSGAAGGIAFGLMAGLGARLLPGFDLVSAWLDLDRRIGDCDVVITGEGRFDASSLGGKGPGAIAARAIAAGKTVHVFAGQVDASATPGLHLHPITAPGTPLAEALRETRERLGACVRGVF
jgi:glycerate kinase